MSTSSPPLSAPVISAASGALNTNLTGKPIVARMGDSRLAQELQVLNPGAANQAVNRMGQGVGGWVQFLSKGRISCPMTYNVAVSGSTTTDIINSQLANLANLSPRPTHVIILSVTNDINVTPQATIKSNLLAIWAAVKALGIVPVQIMDLPRTLASWTSVYRSLSYEINAWMRSACVANGVVLIDPLASIVDPANAAGDPLSSMIVVDGIHPQYVEAYVVSNALVSYFNTLGLPSIQYQTSQADAYDATNNPRGNFLPSGGLMIGTSGTNTGSGASGTVPTGWNNRVVSGTGASVSSIVARTDGGPGNCWQLSVTATTDTLIRLSPVTNITPAAGYATGDIFWFEADILVSGANRLAYTTLILQDFNGSSVLLSSQDMKGSLIGTTQYYQPASYSGRLKTDPVQIGVTTGASFLVTRCEILVSAGGSATVQIAGPSVRKMI